MGRTSTVHKYIGKEIAGIVILKPLNLRDCGICQRLFVECQCLHCGKIFEAQFHNVYKGGYKSCGCIQYTVGAKNPKWRGCGEISWSIFISLRHGAKARNFEFNITIEEMWNLFLKQNRKCKFTNLELVFPSQRTDNQATASLDRIDSSKGYILNNVQWVHKEINFMKQDHTDERFIELCKLVAENNK